MLTIVRERRRRAASRAREETVIGATVRVAENVWTGVYIGIRASKASAITRTDASAVARASARVGESEGRSPSEEDEVRRLRAATEERLHRADNSREIPYRERSPDLPG